MGRRALAPCSCVWAVLFVSACSGDRERGPDPDVSAGCEATCKLVLECTFGAPGAVPECTNECVTDIARKPPGCETATAALGRCARGKSCEDLEGGDCRAELDEATRACGDGDGGPPVDGAPPDGAPLTGCARFEYVASGMACGSCSFRCDCPEGFPVSIASCEADGCIVSGNCEQICAAELSESVPCTDTYTVLGRDAGTPPIDAGPNDGGALLPTGAACGEDAQCASGRCNNPPASSGTCVTGATGDRCFDASDCESALCTAETCTEWRVSWARRGNSSSTNTDNEVVVDSRGNVIVTRNFSEALDYGGGAIAPAGADNLVIVKLSPSGAVLWARVFGLSAMRYPGVEPLSIDTDASDAVLVVARFWNTIDVGPMAHASAGGSDILVLKLAASDGSVVWSRRFGGPGDDGAVGAVHRGTGDIALAGVFTTSIDFGGPALTSPDSDLFAARIGSAGTHVWSRAFVSTGASVADVAVDATGNVALHGSGSAGSVDFGGGALTLDAVGDLFAVKLGPGGGHVWSRRFDSSSFGDADGVAYDPSGDVLVTGAFTRSVDFGGGPLPSVALGRTVYLAKLAAADGAHVWSRSYGGAAWEEGIAVDVSATGAIALGGWYSEATIDFGGGVLPWHGRFDSFVVRLSSSGVPERWFHYGNAGSDRVSDVAFGPAGEIAVAGLFDGMVAFGSSATFTSTGVNDSVVFRLEP